ncbi:hypothetical protein WJX81_007027 [Elliptochloris bilobata]|uniref:Dynamin-type G domain-containing protein n=1 Tax=Elliptochloris bilobata TaxID=381761 RepID=A0AAW1QV71_9CHLO
MDDDMLFNSPDSKIRYEAYTRLQAACSAFGEELPIPEIVAIGGQSDGKSSLLEAFLGFRFNVREVEMGTRRPLIVQMVHDPSADTPRCRLQEEHSEEYGPPIVPETAVADAVKSRTEAHLRQTGGTVSAKPIVMRAEYAYCPNLTIIDTPGFILKAREGEGDTTPNDILSMVKQQAAPGHRLILFLQQSSVEWCSSLWMHVVQEVDPDFQRTVVVASKFDNRLKEFAERWEVDRYLSAAGYLSANVKPFFVALPKERTVSSSAAWRASIAEVDAATLRCLREQVAGGFDEERFGARIGFGNLKRFLEGELARRYRDAAPATLALLAERCGGARGELAAAQAHLHALTDVPTLRRDAMRHVAAMAADVAGVLAGGAAGPDPAVHGLTTAEERATCSASQWPGVATEEVVPPHADLRLYGAAAFERCLQEFQKATKILGFPPVARERVASLLLAEGMRAGGGPPAAARAAAELARAAARALLAPLLGTACSRLAACLRRAFEVAAEGPSLTSGGAAEALRPYVAFHAELRTAFQHFVGRLEAQCRELVAHHLETATSVWSAADLAAALPAPEPAAEDAQSENIPPATEPQLARSPLRESQMSVPETPSPHFLAQKRRAPAGKPRAAPSHQDGGSHAAICQAAERQFRAIREAVAARAAPATLKAAFLEPLARDLPAELAMHVFARTDADFMGLFVASGAVAVLEAKRDALARRLDGLLRCKDEFAELARCL